jgi:uncharacterized protein YkwD
MLQAHNIYRARHCVPSLQLNDKLSLSAQYFAQQLANTNGIGQGNSVGTGRNIFMKSSSAGLSYINGKYTCFYIV